MPMQQQKNKNIIALGVGFGLIILIALITIWKPFAPKNGNNKQNESFQISKNMAAVKQISSEELSAKLRNKDPLSVIDVRSGDEFKQEHILDSQNIPADNFDSDSSALDGNNNYAIVDDGSDNTGLVLAGNLVQKEFKNVYYLTGGFLAWKNKINPTVSTGDPNSFVDQSKVNYINSDKLKEIMQSDNNLYIIDVRKSDAFAQGHLKGSDNIFLDDLEKRRHEIPVGKKIILYDSNGLWAFQGAVRLFDMSILNVSALSDGFDSWKQKGFEMIK